MYVCMYVCMYARMYVCMYVCMYVYTYIYIYIYIKQVSEEGAIINPPGPGAYEPRMGLAALTKADGSVQLGQPKSTVLRSGPNNLSGRSTDIVQTKQTHIYIYIHMYKSLSLYVYIYIYIYEVKVFIISIRPAFPNATCEAQPDLRARTWTPAASLGCAGHSWHCWYY